MKNFYKIENDKKLKSEINSEESFWKRAKKIGETPLMTEKTVFAQILENHMTPRDKWGRVVVEEGSLQYKWEDSQEIYDIDAQNPLIIEPERVHKVILVGEALFRVEFYKLDELEKQGYAENVLRPGENFI